MDQDKNKTSERKYAAPNAAEKYVNWIRSGRSTSSDLLPKELPEIGRWEYLTKLAKAKLSSAAFLRFLYIKYYYLQGHKNAEITAQVYSTSARTIRKWLKRFKETNISSLEAQSRAPKNTRPWMVTWEEEKNLKELRTKYIRYGPRKLQILYKQTYQKDITLWRIQRIIEKHNLYFTPRKSRVRLQAGKIMAEKTRINKMKEAIEKNHQKFGYLWHIDTVTLHASDGARRYIVTAVEDYTRIGFAHTYKNISSKLTADFLKRLYYVANGKVEVIHVDNGAEFQGEFEALCKKLHIEMIYSRVRTPKDNSKLERFNRTIQEEWVEQSLVGCDMIEESNQELAEWLECYNKIRPHETLGYMTPLQFAEQKSYENGTMTPFPTSN